MTETSYEAWILMALVYRNLDDENPSDALMLAERLYGIDKTNSFIVFLYAKCLFRQLDYMGSYSVLIKHIQTDSVPCLYLLGKSCLEMGNLEEDISDKRNYWEKGIDALQKALELMSQEQEGEEEDVYWGDELSSVTTRQHIPSIASVHLLLGDLYVKIDHMKPASIHYKACLEADPFKLAAFIKLCDIAPDCFPLDNQITASFFKSISSIHLSKRETATVSSSTPSTSSISASTKRRKNQHNSYQHSHNQHQHHNLLTTFLPSPPNPNIQDITLFTGREEEYELNSFDLPRIRNVSHKTTLYELRAVATRGSLRSTNSFDTSERDDIEKRKDDIISEVEADIFEMKRSEAYKNKHGLHKKPPVVVPRKLKIDLLDEEEEEENEDEELSISNKDRSNSIDEIPPPRSVKFKKSNNKEDDDDNNDDDNVDGHVRKKHKSQHKKKHDHIEKSNGSFPWEDNEESIVRGMNRILELFKLLASAYMHQSFNECRQTTIQLQRLDDGQYSTPWVVSMIGKAYYNSSDYNTASLFFDYNFVKAPWYCETIPFYTTSLWYLEKKYELNLVAYKMKENKCHKYEAYIAAGNWTKSVGRANETIDWFKKAVEYDPSRYYGYALLGYEELEKEDYLAAKEYFTACMIANKRSYLGWYGLAKAYQGLRTYAMAKTLLEEAVRLHPRHHVILSTMAEVLMELQEYDEALQFIHSSIKLNSRRECTDLQQKILHLKEITEQKDQFHQHVLGFSM